MKKNIAFTISYRRFPNIIKISGAVGVLFLLLNIAGCKKFVQEGPPSTLITTSDVFNNNATVTSAQTYIYSKMISEGFNMEQSCGYLSDELKNYSTNQKLQQYYLNNMNAVTGPGPWTSAYNSYIYYANAIIEGLKGNSSIDPAVNQQLTGESKFVRAFWLFYLTNLYGDIPLVTSTDYTVNKSLARAHQADVYQQIITDLKDAQTLLNANYVDISDTVITTERVRPTKAAASALLARVYLYTQKYDLAEAAASSVISNTLYKLCDNLSLSMGQNYVFQKNNTEAIWQLSTPLPASWNTQDGQSFILVGAPSTSTANCATISPQLLSAFEPGDKRLAQWIGTYSTTTSPIVQYKFPYKYQVTNNPTNILEYTTILRLAEQYLIRAEARAQQNNLPGAIADLNIIRNRAGLPALSASLNQAQVLAAVMQERRVELFCEWGHRWLDLNRTGNTATVMGSPGNVYNAKGNTGSWNANYQLFPIPQSEILNDLNLIQNSGY